MGERNQSIFKVHGALLLIAHASIFRLRAKKQGMVAIFGAFQKT
jgi:hypothetical protein